MTNGTAPGDQGDALDQLVGELTRYVRLTHRFKGMVNSGEGAEQSALLLLPALTAFGPLRVTELADIKQADPSTVSRQAAQLVRAGLARKEPDPADGRATRLALTAQGEAACGRLQSRRRALVAAALRDWSATDVTTFARLFQAFNSAVESHVRAACDIPAPAGTPDVETPTQESL